MYPHKDNCNYYRKIIKHSSEEVFRHIHSTIKGIELVSNYKTKQHPDNNSYMCEELSYIISYLINLAFEADLRVIVNSLVNDPIIPTKVLEVILVESYMSSSCDLEDVFVEAINKIKGKED